jgi:ATP-dependent Lhr-like helicase
MNPKSEAFGFLGFHPDVEAWCAGELGEPTPPQRAAIPLGLAQRNTLICSPTGTGKTLAAFLPAFSALADKRDSGELFARTYVLYISPLRALGYDVEHNLRRPLRAMDLLEKPNGERPRKRRGRIRERFDRTGVRTSDTPQEERRLMLARPPHILVTTPESLAVMLAMDSYRKTLRYVERVILDEIHALAANKRGAQLSLLLESLEELTVGSFSRIGLSATVTPLDRVARYVAGADRPCEIVDCRGLRSIRIEIEAPFAGASAPLTAVAQTAVELIQDQRTTLIFTNVRSQAERVAHEMGRAIDERSIEVTADQQTPREYDKRIGVHHSALERSVRHRVEASLRAGTLRAVVCSSSLELGVDIGFVDRVLIVGGARGVTSTLQRIGRAGHRPDAVAYGVVIAQDRDDIVEAAATRRCIADGALEEMILPQAPLDVLAQWMVMSVCYDKRLAIDDLVTIARRALPFADVPRSDLVDCARYLSGAGVGDDPAHVHRLGFDGEAIYGLGREVCAAYFDNVGTIPDEKHVGVRILGGEGIGRLEEGFVNELRTGDIFVLNGSTLRVKEIGTTGIVAEPFAGRPTVPQWSSHMKGVGPLLAAEIARLRVGVSGRLARGPASALEWLASRYGLTGVPAAHVVRYIAQQRALSAVPDVTRPIVEIYRMDRKQTAVFHTCAGRRVNETLARAVGARVMKRLRVGTSITTDDNGFLVTLPLGVTLPDAAWASMLAPSNFEADVLAGVKSTHLLRNHFRYVANTGLLVLRRAGGRSLRRGTQVWNSGRILERVAARDPRFPLLRETLRTVTRDLLDLPGALQYVENLEGEPRVLHPPAASPFTFGILTSSFGDSVVLDDRAAMVAALHDRVLQLLGEGVSPDADEPTLALRYS